MTQRPQHLLTRAAAEYDVIYWEEPQFSDSDTPVGIQVELEEGPVTVMRPTLPWTSDDAEMDRLQRNLLDRSLAALGRPVSVLWFYTPMAMSFASHVRADTTIYDCMDELAAFAGASPRLLLLERRLLRRADLVFTGGRSLQRAKQHLHPETHCFPSAVDCAHYAKARRHHGPEPADQAPIPHPRIGFFGVIDERLDTDLIADLADRRPDWHIVIIGPTAKIDEAELPARPNLHWLGPKSYAELPAYLSGWDAGFMPFALNDATRFISPTKTPEFLAAGVKLVSTPIADVVAAWATVVSIAASAAEMEIKLDALLQCSTEPWLTKVDHALSGLSWNASWAGMQDLIDSREILERAVDAGD